MWPRLTDQALELGDEMTTFVDLLLLGVATGLVEEAMGFTRRGLWAVEQADSDLSREKLLDEAVGFRRARRLESGQDLRTWLEAHLLTMGDFEAHLRRCLAVQQLATTAIPAGAPEIGLDCRAFAVDLVCGGWWRRFADLAGRLWAASRLVGNDLDVDEDQITVDSGRIMAMLEPLVGLGEPWCAGTLRKIRTRERALEEISLRCATTDAVAARILEHATEWTELRFDQLLLTSREAANEALLCALRRRRLCSRSRRTSTAPTGAAVLAPRRSSCRGSLPSRRRATRQTIRAGRLQRAVGRALARANGADPPSRTRRRERPHRPNCSKRRSCEPGRDLSGKWACCDHPGERP